VRLELDTLTLHEFKHIQSATLKIGMPAGLYYVRGQNNRNRRLGANGVGKSSLWDALTWVLFGRTVRGLRNPDVRAWRPDGQTWVRLVLHVDRQKRTIRRTISPNKILLDGELIMQEALERKLGLTYEVWLHTVVFGQLGRPLFFDLAPRDKLGLFSDVLMLQRWDERAEKASRQADTIEAECVRIDGTIRSFEGGYEQVKRNRVGFLEQSRQWEADHTTLLETFESARKEMTKQEARLRKLADGAALRLDSAQTEIVALEREQTQLQQYLRDELAEEAKLATEVRLKREELAELRGLLADLKDMEHCPTCGQSIEGTELHAHYNETRKTIRGLADEIKELNEGTLKGVSISVGELRTQLEITETALADFRLKAHAAQQEVNEYKPRADELVTRLRAAADNRRHRETEANPYAEQARAAKERMDELDGLIEEAEATKQLAERKLKRTRYWVKGFREVKLYIIEEILDELELASNAMCDELGLVGWEIRYDVERETKSGSLTRGINVSILSPENKNPVRFEVWSGGETQRLRLIGAIALSNVLLSHAGVECPLMVFDEPTEHLSQEGINDVVDILADYARSRQSTIYYTDHRVIQSSRFAGTLTVTRNKTHTTVEMK
jgi:DNA repair exonuclease SbcCD ATPase subunit